jgi:hypothetical protein
MLRNLWKVAALGLLIAPAVPAQEDKWVSLFDGKTMSGWEMKKTTPDSDGKWVVQDGAIVGTGKPSMLYSPKGEYKNFKVRAEIQINDKGNSGFYFRAKNDGSFSSGYEAQIDTTHTDPIRTGSLYGHCHVYRQLHKPGEWFTYELEVKDGVWRGRPMTSIRITVNGEELYDYMDFAQTHKVGHFAFQGHDPGSTVKIRKVEVMELP